MDNSINIFLYMQDGRRNGFAHKIKALEQLIVSESCLFCFTHRER